MKAARNVLLVILGIAAGLLVTELSLRLAGLLYLDARKTDPVRSEEPERRPVVLCAGDSFTYGLGAGPGEAYPERLQRRFDEAGADVSVVNTGVLGYNSSQLARHLQKRIDRYRPAAVVVMTGMNDRFFLAESNYYLFTDGLDALLSRLDATLSGLRTYELIRLVFARPSAGARATPAAVAPAPSGTAVGPDVAEAVRRKFDRRLARGDRLSDALSADRAIEEYRAAVALVPEDPRGHTALGLAYLHGTNDYPKAVAAFREALRLDPRADAAGRELWQALYRMGRPAEAREALGRYLRAHPEIDRTPFETALERGMPPVDDAALFDRLLRYNLASIVATARANGVPVILMDYPGMGAAFPNSAIRRFARRHDIPLVENGAVFAALLAREPRDRYFAPDCHCNAAGYAVVAERAYAALMREVPRLTAGRGGE